MRTVAVKMISFVSPPGARLDIQESHLRTLNKTMRSIEGNLAGVIILPAVFGFLTPKSAYEQQKS
jgi:hypothetical protein